MTSRSKSTLERIADRIPMPEEAYERVLLRRDRKRRNQRITAGVVGMALFLPSLWVVTTVGSSDERPIPAGLGETGPTVTEPTGWDGRGLPPEGMVPSTPEEGVIVAELDGGLGPDALVGWVYADGRVIWGEGDVLHERHLTPEGVELVRSGTIAPEDLGPPWIHYPASAWADQESRPYVAPQYAICYAADLAIVDPSSVTGLLPAEAEALLGGKERTYHDVTLDLGVVDRVPTSTCFELTTEDARTLDEILSDAGFVRQPSVDGVGLSGPVAGFNFAPPAGSDQTISIWFAPLLPHGEWAALCRCG